jgi:hypothetical protein
MNMRVVKELADAHWNYIEDLLITHGEDSKVVEKIEFHYKAAMLHGWKHAYEHMMSEVPVDLGEGRWWIPFGQDSFKGEPPKWQS